jgi:hypothetical protein
MRDRWHRILDFFRRKDEMSLVADIDSRWSQWQNKEWTCNGCGLSHKGVLDLAFTRPEQWRDSEEYEPNSKVGSPRHVLSEDFCILDDEHFFVRSVLELPLVGASGARFGYGVWTTLSRKNFDIYVSNFDSGCSSDLGPWFGWFSNRLKGYPETLNLKCQIYPQADRQRPLIELEPSDHPLAIEQRDGITFERYSELLVANGHDLTEDKRKFLN